VSRGPAATRPTRATPGRSDRSSQGWRPRGGTHSAAATPSRRHPRDPRPQAGPRTSETLPRNVAQHHSARSGRTGSHSSPVSSEVPTRLRATTRTGRTQCRVHQPRRSRSRNPSTVPMRRPRRPRATYRGPNRGIQSSLRLSHHRRGIGYRIGAYERSCWVTKSSGSSFSQFGPDRRAHDARRSPRAP